MIEEFHRLFKSCGFGYLLEQSRYLVFDCSSVENIGLDESEPVSRLSEDWFGFRNRFWTAMVLPAATVSIIPLTGEMVEDARVEFTHQGQSPGQHQDWDLDIYLGPIEPGALSTSAAELETLMYSGLPGGDLYTGW